MPGLDLLQPVFWPPALPKRESRQPPLAGPAAALPKRLFCQQLSVFGGDDASAASQFQTFYLFLFASSASSYLHRSAKTLAVGSRTFFPARLPSMPPPYPQPTLRFRGYTLVSWLATPSFSKNVSEMSSPLGWDRLLPLSGL